QSSYFAAKAVRLPPDNSIVVVSPAHNENDNNFLFNIVVSSFVNEFYNGLTTGLYRILCINDRCNFFQFLHRIN
ncbi:hypothetical protein, partial [Bacillus thuringiensis]|uniref:hypothetical protein n=1 Tax=Bacillus thuringiensis TaxID=1428 RepID=UPI003BF6D3FC